MRRAPGCRVRIDGRQALRELSAPAAACGGADSRPRTEAAAIVGGSDDRLTSGERVGQGAAVDILELAADRHAVRDPAGAQAAAGGELREKVRGGLAFDRWIGGENQLAHRALLENRLELADPELLRAHSIER